MIREHLLPALSANLLTLVATGILFPLATTGIAQVLFARQANGSIVRDESGHAVGSALLAQKFALAGYLQPRPSAAGDAGYDGLSSGGSNLGPTSAKLRDRAKADAQRLAQENPQAGGQVPAELLAMSGSGLDPHLSPDAALWQVPRIASARHVEPARVQAVIAAQTEGRDLGFLGEPRVDVLAVNLALDRLLGRLPLPPPPPPAAPAPAPAPSPR